MDITAETKLTPGLYQLMAKILNNGRDWKFGVRIMDEEERLLAEGLRITPDPADCGDGEVKFRRGMLMPAAR